MQFAHFDTNSNAFISFLLQFWNVQYKVEYLSLIISEIIYSERAVFFFAVKRLKDLASEQHSVNNFNGFKHSWNQHGTTIILFFHEFGKYWIWKKSLSVWFVILRLFVNILAADNKYSRCNFHTLTQIQTPLSLKQDFLDFLLQFWNVHEI